VDECTTNVIRHAYRGQPGQPIELRFSPDGNEFRVEVLDDGEAVDPRAVPRVDLQRYAAERRKGGLGVHLMAKLMDSVSYSRCSSRNLCRMVKRKPRAGRAGTDRGMAGVPAVFEYQRALEAFRRGSGDAEALLKRMSELISLST